MHLCEIFRTWNVHLVLITVLTSSIQIRDHKLSLQKRNGVRKYWLIMRIRRWGTHLKNIWVAILWVKNKPTFVLIIGYSWKGLINSLQTTARQCGYFRILQSLEVKSVLRLDLTRKLEKMALWRTLWSFGREQRFSNKIWRVSIDWRKRWSAKRQSSRQTQLCHVGNSLVSRNTIQGRCIIRQDSFSNSDVGMKLRCYNADKDCHSTKYKEIFVYLKPLARV